LSLLVDAYGRPMSGVRSDGFPVVAREPAPLLHGRFKTIKEAEEAAAWGLQGFFQWPALLCDQVLRVPRVRGPFQTRAAALIGTEINWLPGRDNRDGRRAVEAIKEDWPKIAEPAARAALSTWGQLLVGIAQKHWYHSAEAGRWIPRLEPWHPQQTMFDWNLNGRRGAYRIYTLDGWRTVPSPALTVPGELFLYDPVQAGSINGKPATVWKVLEGGGLAESQRQWVFHEPHGPHSWRNALIYALWASALGWEFADRDMAKLCERQGLGGLKLKYPKTTEGKNAQGVVDPNSSLGLFMTAVKNLGSRFIIPVEQYPQNGPQTLASYDVETFEWSGAGWEIVNGTKESKALDLGILILGHNTTVQSSTAGASAGARVGNDVRDDIRVRDCLDESATMHHQVLCDWAEVNFGDPGLAPIPVPRGLSTTANVPAAQTLLTVGQAVQILRAQGLDEESCEQVLAGFQIPTGAGLGPVTAAAPAPPAPKSSQEGPSP